MREFTCIVCGKKGIDHSGNQSKRYCGSACSERHYLLTHPLVVCPHNEAVECRLLRCDRCGWNPQVAQMRMEAAVEPE